MSDEPSGGGLDATMRDFAAGQKVFNRYTLIRTLGRGGMGVVWLAHDEVLDRDVALKFLPEIIIQDRAVLEDLKKETKRSLELTHKNIVRIHDFVHDVISGCISMEYIEGDTLSNLRADKPNKIFEPDELKPWLRQLCDALDYAHNHARIIHRDLKPANLMISRRGHVKVADFGIARSLSDSVSMLTHARGTSGTLVYMSPQQLDGERGTHLDDIYSLGATIYELLTSKPPFYSGDVSRQVHERSAPTMMQRRRDLEIEGSPIPKNWEETVAACLAKDPVRRPQSVAEIANRLTLASLQTREVAEVPAKRSKKKTFLLATAVTVCLVAAAAWWFGVYQPAKTAHQLESAQNKPETVPTQFPTAAPTQIPTAQPAPETTTAPTATATKQLSVRQILVLRGGGSLTAASFSPDGKRIVTASLDWTARTWDAEIGKELGKLQHEAAVNTASFSPDGKRIVTACDDKTARIWDAETGNALGKPLEHEQSVNAAGFSPDGKLIITASFEYTARLWDAETGKALGKPLRHEKSVNAASFSPDGKFIVTASEDKTARIWNAETGKALGEPLQHEGEVKVAHFSSNGKRIVTASIPDGTAQIWDAETGKPLGKPLLTRAYAANFSPDGKRIVTTTMSGTAEIWDAETGEALSEPLQHKEWLRDANFSPDGKRIVTACDDHIARVWEITELGHAATATPPNTPTLPPVPETKTKETASHASPAAVAVSHLNRVEIRPLKKTYVKVIMNNDDKKPVLERWIFPAESPLHFEGKHFKILVLNRDSVQIKKNGNTVSTGDDDVEISE